nr:MAG: hypothetical protein [Skomarfal virus 56]
MPSAQFRAVCFTLNNPTELIDFPDFVRYAVYQKEKVTTAHYQGYIELKDKKSLAALKKWLPTAHFEPRRGTRDQARDYCMKEDSRLEGPWEHGTWETNSGARTDIATVKDAIYAGSTKRAIFDEFPDIAAKYPRFIDQCLNFALQDKAVLVHDIQPRPWQASLLASLELTPDPRQVLWFTDSTGGSGKTHLARYLVDSKGAFYCRGGKAADIAYAYQYQPVVIFDYTRDHEDFVNYSMLEQFKDGMVSSSKYESTLKRCNCPHVIVFSNFEPDRSKMSADRWNVTNLSWSLGGISMT